MKNPFIALRNIFTKSKSEYSSDNVADIKTLFGTTTAITSNTAQQIANVFACVNIKANALAVMPVKLYKIMENGKKEYKESALYNILRYEPNDNLISSLYKKMISQDLDLRGNHYSQIVKNGLNQIVAIYPLIADKMVVQFDKDGKRVYQYDGQYIPSSRILHIIDIPDSIGLKGISRIEYARETLEFAKNTSRYGNRLFKNSATPSGVFENPGELSEEAYKRLKKDIIEKYTDLEKAGTPLLLEGGLTFKPLTIKNSDAEWLASRKFNREEIASIFGVPVAMLNDATNTAYGNLEQKYLEFYSGTILPLTTIIEEQLRQSLLNPQQKRELSIKFKYNAMLRVDTKTRAEYYQTRFNIGSISPNEIREYEDENGFDGGDEHFIQLNLSTVKNVTKGQEK